jgi:vanillate O-demethylase monooxygenase subunit
VNGEANMHWEAPANMMLDTNAAALDESDKVVLPQAHVLTPESETSTHYFWGVSRDRVHDDLQLEQMLFHGLNNAFLNEDEPMIAKVQARMRNRSLFEMSPVLLPMDAAAIRARRILERKINEEAGAAA